GLGVPPMGRGTPARALRQREGDRVRSASGADDLRSDVVDSSPAPARRVTEDGERLVDGPPESFSQDSLGLLDDDSRLQRALELVDPFAGRLELGVDGTKIVHRVRCCPFNGIANPKIRNI